MSVERLTHEADFGLEDWEETLFFVKSDPNGAYNILDIAKYQGESEFDEILKNIAIRLSEIENILGDTYDLDRLWELVKADKAGRCVVLPVKPGDTVWYLTGNPSMTNRLCFDRVDSARVVGFYFDERGMQVRLDYFHGSHGTYGFYGKTVFSTREAAEAALAKEDYHE